MKTDNLNVPDLKGKRLLICEEALINYKGHFYSWIKAIRTIHLQAGAEVFVAGNKHVDAAIQEEFDVVPAYSINSWSGIYDYPQAWKRYLAVFRHNWRVFRETRQVLKETGPVDCILLPAARIYHLLAWRLLCRVSLGKSFKRVVIFVLTSEAQYNADFTSFQFKRTAELIKKVLAGFKTYVQKGTVVLAGDSHITAGEYEKLADVPFRVFPSPAAGLNASSGITGFTTKTGPVTFVILGVAFIDKGIDILQQAILTLLASNPHINARFIIQWAISTVGYDGQNVEISPMLRDAPQVELLERVLSEEDYARYMQEADFLVLPYRRIVYFNRISGVAVEAACSGIPMIVTENTWLAWAMKTFGAGVEVRDGDAADLAAKIEYCVAERANLARQAFNRKETALQQNSSISYLNAVWS